MKKSFMLLLFFYSLSAFSQNCFNPTDLNCHFYPDCLEKKSSCGESGYALGYGQRYCEKFLENPHFSYKGIQWRNRTLICLQQALVPVIEVTLPVEQFSCKEIADLAFMSHSRCYTKEENSICDLPKTDILNVFLTIDGKDLLSSRGIKQIKQVSKICLVQLWVRKNMFLLRNKRLEMRSIKRKTLFWRDLYQNRD